MRETFPAWMSQSINPNLILPKGEYIFSVGHEFEADRMGGNYGDDDEKKPQGTGNKRF